MANKFKTFVKSDKAKWGAVIVAGVILAGGIIGLTVRVSNNETTRKLGASSFQVGLLNDDDGKYPTKDVDKSGLSTKSFYKLEDLVSIKVAEDAEIKYHVNYYGEDKNFLGASQALEESYNSEIVTGVENLSSAKYIKIEIVPTEDDDETVSWLEKFSYVKQLTVTVAK